VKISGHMDLCGPTLIEGWLHCDAWDGDPISLQVYSGDHLIGECNADRFRLDLQEAGYGDGRCGFTFSVPDEVEVGNFTAIKLRLIDTPVYMLPDEFTSVAPRGVGSRAGEAGEHQVLWERPDRSGESASQSKGLGECG
jgi:hypothetical protein